jgi:kynurenine formamidase
VSRCLPHSLADEERVCSFARPGQRRASLAPCGGARFPTLAALDCSAVTEYRARFDADVEFANGGRLTAEGFRLDLPGPELSYEQIAELFVRHLGLALVSGVELRAVEIVAESHKGSRGVAAAPTTAPSGRLVDLSHTIAAGLVTYPGIPVPTINPHLTREESRSHYAEGTEFAIDMITMVGNTGTYLDTPYHRYAGGADLADLDLETLVDLPLELFRLTDARERGIPAAVFYDRDLQGKAVLLDTGWDRHFGTTAYAAGAPYLDGDAAAYLIRAGAVLVGIDSINIDDAETTRERPAHSQLLAAGVHVVEHLTNLAAVPPTGARFTAVPPKVRKFGTFPVRAFAKLPRAH